MTAPITRRRALAAAALAPLASPSLAAPPSFPRLRPSFEETFRGPLDLYGSGAPKGRWKTNYWFGDQADISSRALPDERQAYVDQAFCGIDPFVQEARGLRIVAARNSRPADRRLFNPYTGRKAPIPYTSGLLTTETSHRQRYGYFEAVMTFPQVRGCWPAFWLLGPPHGPHSGDEIDVVEWVASNPRRLFFNAHAAGKAQAVWFDGFDTARPHAYGLLWTADRLVWFVDGKKLHERPNPGLHEPMYMLLNLAVGGWDDNLPEDAGRFPASLLISSVKAYSLAERD